jgi:hypothetical protein
VNEHVRLAAALLDEAKALGGVEKLHGSSSHTISFQIDANYRRLAECQTSQFSKLRGKIVGAQRRQKQRSFSKIDIIHIAFKLTPGKTTPDIFIQGPPFAVSQPAHLGLGDSAGHLLRHGTFRCR